MGRLAEHVVRQWWTDRRWIADEQPRALAEQVTLLLQVPCRNEAEEFSSWGNVTRPDPDLLFFRGDTELIVGGAKPPRDRANRRV
jgi:hypothetical protein